MSYIPPPEMSGQNPVAPTPQTVDEFKAFFDQYSLGKYFMLFTKSAGPGIVTQGRLVAKDWTRGAIVLQSDNYPDKAEVVWLSDIQVATPKSGSGSTQAVQVGDWVHDQSFNWYRKQDRPYDT